MRKRSESDLYTAIIIGEPCSKANSRRVVYIDKKIRVIKSKKAINYLKNFALQCPIRDNLFTNDVAVGMRIHYASRRQDLDESLILDALQDYAYQNDRQVKAKFILHALDKENPRTQIIVAPIDKLTNIISVLSNV